MMKYFSVLTALGEQKLAKATAEGTTIQLTQIAVGDGGGTLPVPNVNQTQLIHENYRANINTLKIDSTKRNRVIAELVVPSSVGGWWTREIGLFDSNGELFAVGNCPDVYKPSRAEGASSDQFFRLVLTTSHTEHITITYDPLVASATVNALNKAVALFNQTIEAHEKSRNHPDASLIAKGFTQLSSDVNSLDETMSATPKAIKIAMDNALARLAKDRNGADIPNPALFRQNIELGNSATRNVGTTINTVAAGDDGRILAAKKAIEDTQIGRPYQILLRINTPDDLSNLPAGARRFARNAPGVSVLPTGNYFYLEVVAKRDVVNGTCIWAVEAHNPESVWLGIRYNATTTPDFTWAKQYSTLNKPTAADIGTDTTAQIDTKVAAAKKAGTDAQLTANAAQTAAASANTNANSRVPNTRTINGKPLTTNITLTASDLGILSVFPVGSPIPWPQAIAPPGFLVCNGQSFNRTTYPLLASAYPSGILPDLRGEFIRGLDAGRNVDSARTVLSAQGDAIRDIEGGFTIDDQISNTIYPPFGAFKVIPGIVNYDAASDRSSRGLKLEFKASYSGVPTANENRPRNIAFLYIVRAA